MDVATLVTTYSRVCNTPEFQHRIYTLPFTHKTLDPSCLALLSEITDKKTMSSVQTLGFYVCAIDILVAKHIVGESLPYYNYLFYSSRAIREGNDLLFYQAGDLFCYQMATQLYFEYTVDTFPYKHYLTQELKILEQSNEAIVDSTCDSNKRHKP